MKKRDYGPYEALGTRIKFLREQWQQTVGEVAGTLEIDEATLQAIELGRAIPAEEQMDLLISHFLLTEDQADDLRELADLQRDHAGDHLGGGMEDMLMKQIIMYLPVDNRIVYTDHMQATVNNHGVVLRFMQSVPNAQQISVSQVGMSREHAERLVEILRGTLDQHDRSQQQKLLPAPKEKES